MFLPADQTELFPRIIAAGGIRKLREQGTGEPIEHGFLSGQGGGICHGRAGEGGQAKAAGEDDRMRGGAGVQ